MTTNVLYMHDKHVKLSTASTSNSVRYAGTTETSDSNAVNNASIKHNSKLYVHVHVYGA